MLLGAAPWFPGLALFAILFGFGCGLASIVGGTLPLELFGETGYGGRLGWVTAARQFSAALAPDLFAVALESLGPTAAVSIAIVCAAVAVVLFGLITLLRHRHAAVLQEAAAQI
ncbi:MFS family permease [Pseudorhizobium tarimense]|uniref:MFS family permease n=1 Tax=Pseudorhizobium tarimense TaxID=1079109 RepID=A0ABV2HCG8_9HYPH|nr:hypothetical protein [Pseudorhizobium tarimense]MCJ8521295.1 hypothetical protein [Pseudorhizobium tarimense]